MEIKIEGDPGTGNTYQEIKIGHIENNFPAVKEVTIIKGPDGLKVKNKTTDDQSNSHEEKSGKRADIINYVEKTLPFVLFQWKDKYMTLWDDILKLPEVDAVIYNKGRQQKTSFNRKELCHLICYVGQHAVDGYGIFEKYNATHIANAFNDGAEKSTRPELGFQPPIPIRKALEKLFKSKKYQ